MRDRLLTLLCDVLNLEEAPPFEECTAERLSDWDSIASLNLILSVEAEYGVSFPIDEIVELNSLTAIETALLQQGISA